MRENQNVPEEIGHSSSSGDDDAHINEAPDTPPDLDEDIRASGHEADANPGVTEEPESK